MTADPEAASLEVPKAKILVVDDTPANLVAMRRLLSRVDAELVEAGSGNEALAACLDHDFALILLDVNMPEMDGFEVANLLADDEGTRATPIIFVTAAYADDLHRLKGYDSGAVDYIAKPINDTILLSKVRVFLELYNNRSRIQRMAETLFEKSKQLQHEISQRQDAEAKVRHLAMHDPLTGLPNRLLLMDRIRGAIERARRRHQPFALLFVDIDGFKPVNDTHGHQAGDVLLRSIGERLRAGVRALDTVARIGGDEFALILEEPADAEDALHSAERLCDALKQPFDLQPEGADKPVTVSVGGSLGVAMFPDDGDTPDTLLRRADEAMYNAKRSGRNRCVLATPTPSDN